MAEITKDSTLREVLKDYAKRKDRGDTFVSEGVKLFKDIADQKGSALKLFVPDKEGKTLLSKRLAQAPEGTALKQPMQNLRQVGLSLKSAIPSTDKLYELLPDKETSSSKNLKIFGVEEPAKAKSLVSVNPNPEVLRELFEKVADFKKDPALEAVADAVLFNLQNGLRPNAAAGLRVDGSYFPDSGSIYISSEATGAKGRMISIPLSGLSDSILQDRIKNNKVKDIEAYKKGKINYNKGRYFFVKQNGKVVDSSDMTALLKRIKVKNILYDQKTEKYFDTLAPLDKDAPGKTGSVFFRNIHTQLAGRSGVPSDRAAYLQGRSTVGLAKGPTGELTTYDVSFPGGVDPKGADARYANTISDVFAPSAKKYGYDLSGSVSRITSQTEGYSKYFDAPVMDKAPVTPSPTVQGEPSKGLMDKLAKFGITIGKKIPIVAAGIVYAEQKQAGASTGEALGYAGSEFLPISASDADMAGAFVKKARDEGLPEAIGLDTEKQKQMNITRKQRLADRVKQNTSVTLPPEEGFINQNQMGE
tara:strand:- start:81 stop:1673 length:1593 start_codon:yes stop_codon:yes gene_type:complete